MYQDFSFSAPGLSLFFVFDLRFGQFSCLQNLFLDVRHSPRPPLRILKCRKKNQNLCEIQFQVNPFRGFREQLSISTDQVTHLSHSLRRVAGLWRNTFPFFSDSFRNREGMKNTIGKCMHQGHRKMILQNKIFQCNLEISQMCWLRATFCGFLVESLWKKFLKQKPPHPIFDLLARPKTSFDLWRKQL